MVYMNLSSQEVEFIAGQVMDVLEEHWSQFKYVKPKVRSVSGSVHIFDQGLDTIVTISDQGIFPKWGTVRSILVQKGGNLRYLLTTLEDQWNALKTVKDAAAITGYTQGSFRQYMSTDEDLKKIRVDLPGGDRFPQIELLAWAEKKAERREQAQRETTALARAAKAEKAKAKAAEGGKED